MNFKTVIAKVIGLGTRLFKSSILIILSLVLGVYFVIRIYAEGDILWLKAILLLKRIDKIHV